MWQERVTKCASHQIRRPTHESAGAQRCVQRSLTPTKILGGGPTTSSHLTVSSCFNAPSVADWLPKNHPAWFVIDVVAELDTSSVAYPPDDVGHATCDPQMLLALSVHASCVGERSSRRIEKAFGRGAVRKGGRAANQRPDHTRSPGFVPAIKPRSRRCSARLLRYVHAVALLRPRLVALIGPPSRSRKNRSRRDRRSRGRRRHFSRRRKSDEGSARRVGATRPQFNSWSPRSRLSIKSTRGLLTDGIGGRQPSETSSILD